MEYIISAGIGVAVAVIICLVVALVTNTKRKNAVAMINSAKDEAKRITEEAVRGGSKEKRDDCRSEGRYSPRQDRG